jgi:hypothetical protein
VELEEIGRRVRAMPKAEVHVHLEGATDAETVWRMAARNGAACVPGRTDPLPAPASEFATTALRERGCIAGPWRARKSSFLFRG